MPVGSRESTTNLFKLILASRTLDFFEWEFFRDVFSFIVLFVCFWVAANNLVMLIKPIQMKSALWDKLQKSKRKNNP